MAYIGNKPAELAVDIDNASVTTEKLANDAVTAAKIVDGTIIADDLNNGIITNSKVASNAAIAATKLAVSGGSNITLQSDGTFDLDNTIDITGAYQQNGTNVITSSGGFRVPNGQDLQIGNAASNTGKLQIYLGNTTAYRLDVFGSTAAREVLFQGSSSGGKYNFRFKNEGSGGADLDISNGGLQIGGSTVIDSSRAITADGLTVDTNTLHVDATNNRVGIGSSVPGMLLEVDASSGSANDIARFSGRNSGGLTFRNATANEFILHTATSDALIFGTNGNNERMRIGSDGAVTLKPNGITTGLRLQGRSNDNNFYVQFKSNDGNTTYSQIGTSSADTALLYQSNVHKFQNTASNNTYMTINASGMLGVGGDTARGSYTDLLLQDTTDNAQMEFKGANTSFAISHFDNGRLGIYSNVSGTWNEARGISINAATGNVGVGTTDGDERLHVNGSILVDAFNAGHEEGIFFRDGFSNSNKYNISILAYDHGSADAGQSTTSPDGLAINAYDGISFNVGSNARNEVMRIKGGTANVGNVGIGSQNPSRLLHLYSASVDPYLLIDGSGGNRDSGIIINAGGGERKVVRGDLGGNLYFGNNNQIALYDGGEVVINQAGNNADFRVESVNQSHAIFVDADNNAVIIGHDVATTSTASAYFGALHTGSQHFVVSHTASDANSALLYLNRQSSNGRTIEFRRGNANVGTIDVTTSGTTYNTTSDRRLKTDIQPIADATDMLMAMNPVKHGWKADPHTGETVHGFIAQEMQEIVPEAVSGDPDAEEMMSMDYGRITPVLVAALQDAHKKIEAFEERLAELESK